jgi:hypothetical protein
VKRNLKFGDFLCFGRYYFLSFFLMFFHFLTSNLVYFLFLMSYLTFSVRIILKKVALLDQ